MSASSPQKASKRKVASKQKAHPAPKTPVKTAKKSRNHNHPKFIDMIVEGLQKMNEKSGSSRQAILKFIVSNYPVDQKLANQYVKIALKNGVKSGLLKQLKGIGASGSFKLADKTAKPKRTARPALKINTEKKTSLKKTAVTKTKSVSKPAPKIKTVTKEVAAAQLPSAPVRGRKPPTVREQVVSKKSRAKKPTATPVQATTEEVTTPVEEKKAESEKQVRVSARRAAEAKSKRAAVSTRGKKKEAETTELTQS